MELCFIARFINGKQRELRAKKQMSEKRKTNDDAYDEVFRERSRVSYDTGYSDFQMPNQEIAASFVNNNAEERMEEVDDNRQSNGFQSHIFTTLIGQYRSQFKNSSIQQIYHLNAIVVDKNLRLQFFSIIGRAERSDVYIDIRFDGRWKLGVGNHKNPWINYVNFWQQNHGSYIYFDLNPDGYDSVSEVNKAIHGFVFSGADYPENIYGLYQDKLVANIDSIQFKVFENQRFFDLSPRSNGLRGSYINKVREMIPVRPFSSSIRGGASKRRRKLCMSRRRRRQKKTRCCRKRRRSSSYK